MPAGTPRAFVRLTVWCACLMLGGEVIVAQRAPLLFAECEPRAGETWTYDRLMCVRRVGTARGRRDEVRRRLRELGAEDPSHPWATLVLAHLTLDERQRPQAIAL